jgi:hypothetical protein
MNSYTNRGRRCCQVLLVLLAAGVASGCATNASRDGIDALNLSSVYVGMPRSNFEELVGEPIEQSQTREHVFHTYKYDRGYTGCFESGRCQEAENSKTAETLLLIGTLGLSGLSTWYEVNKCQIGYLSASFGYGDKLVNINILAPEPFKGGTYLWDKEQYDPEPWYPCREVYNNPKPSTIPAAVLNNRAAQ